MPTLSQYRDHHSPHRTSNARAAVLRQAASYICIAAGIMAMVGCKPNRTNPGPSPLPIDAPSRAAQDRWLNRTCADYALKPIVDSLIVHRPALVSSFLALWTLGPVAAAVSRESSFAATQFDRMKVYSGKHDSSSVVGDTILPLSMTKLEFVSAHILRYRNRLAKHSLLGLVILADTTLRTILYAQAIDSTLPQHVELQRAFAYRHHLELTMTLP
jgi:hypothetical protein